MNGGHIACWEFCDPATCRIRSPRKSPDVRKSPARDRRTHSCVAVLIVMSAPCFILPRRREARAGPIQKWRVFSVWMFAAAGDGGGFQPVAAVQADAFAVVSRKGEAVLSRPIVPVRVSRSTNAMAFVNVRTPIGHKFSSLRGEVKTRCVLSSQAVRCCQVKGRLRAATLMQAGIS